MTLEEKIAELMRLGMSRERAEQAAMIELGLSDGDMIERHEVEDASPSEDD